MDETEGIIASIIAVLFGVISVFLVISLNDTYIKQKDLVLQVCDYSRVANTDTVTELCTKFQQQTETEYLCNSKNECKVE